MDLVKFLKENACIKFPVSINRGDRFSYAFTMSDDDYDHSHLFFEDLEKDLLLKDPKKKLNFYFKEDFDYLAQFQQHCLKWLVKQAPTMPEFNNVFNTFFKHFPAHEVFQAFNLESTESASPDKSLNSPYVVYLLNQDFSDLAIRANDFLDIVNLAITVGNDNYEELREGLYIFLSKYKHLVSHSVDKNSVKTDSHLLDFDFSLYKAVQKIIKPESLSRFHKFWHSALISDNNIKAPIISASNICAGSLNYLLLSKDFPIINNISVADKVIVEICEFVDRTLCDYFTLYHVLAPTGTFNFIIEFEKNIKEENLAEVFHTILSIVQHLDHLSESQYLNFSQTKYTQAVHLLEKRLDYMALENNLPPKESAPRNNRTKI